MIHNFFLYSCLYLMAKRLLLFIVSNKICFIFVFFPHIERTSARAEICSYARKHFRSLQKVEFGTYVGLIARTPPDIIKPGYILRNGALEGQNGKKVSK